MIKIIEVANDVVGVVRDAYFSPKPVISPTIIVPTNPDSPIEQFLSEKR